MVTSPSAPERRGEVCQDGYPADGRGIANTRHPAIVVGEREHGSRVHLVAHSIDTDDRLPIRPRPDFYPTKAGLFDLDQPGPSSGMT